MHLDDHNFTGFTKDDRRLISMGVGVVLGVVNCGLTNQKLLPTPLGSNVGIVSKTTASPVLWCN